MMSAEGRAVESREDNGILKDQQNPWRIHVDVWQKPLQYCKVISLQLIKIKGKKNTSKERGKETRAGEEGEGLSRKVQRH